MASSPAARIMPSDVIPRIVAGARFATRKTFLPTRSCGRVALGDAGDHGPVAALAGVDRELEQLPGLGHGGGGDDLRDPELASA